MRLKMPQIDHALLKFMQNLFNYFIEMLTFSSLYEHFDSDLRRRLSSHKNANEILDSVLPPTSKINLSRTIFIEKLAFSPSFVEHHDP